MAVTTRPAVIPLAAASDFPPELVAADRRNWTAYDLEGRDGQFTKMPYNPHNGRRAKSNDPTTWGIFTEAHAFAAKHGLGVMLMIAPPLFGFDIDGCIEEGVISPLATSVLGELHTYAEISVSGTGIKGVGIGKKSGTRCRRAGLKLEIYDHSRPFALTGQRLPDAPLAINDCQEGLDFIYSAAFGAEQDAPTVVWDPAAVTDDDDQAVIDWLHNYKNGGRFAAYWSGGGAEDASAGDQGMANMIAWRVGPDPVRIEGIFNASARAGRDKWQQRPAYRASTIRKAIDACGGRFYEARPVFRPQLRQVEEEGEAIVADVDPALYEYLNMPKAELARRAYKAERFNKAIIKFDKSKHIKSQKQTVKAVLFLHANRASQGQLGE
jgi:primase-polymerase (primpol)-like protein